MQQSAIKFKREAFALPKDDENEFWGEWRVTPFRCSFLIDRSVFPGGYNISADGWNRVPEGDNVVRGLAKSHHQCSHAGPISTGNHHRGLHGGCPN